jgi:hypothetical protein
LTERNEARDQGTFAERTDQPDKRQIQKDDPAQQSDPDGSADVSSEHLRRHGRLAAII